MTKKPDLTVVANVYMADGIGRQGIGLIQTLYDDLDINVLKQEPCSFKGIKDSKILATLMKPLNSFGKVAFWTYILGLNESIIESHKKISSDLKIAYSMFESDAIPELWVKILNNYYDCLLVPDPWLVRIYQSSGVKIPIFVLPLGIILNENWLNKKHTKNDIFTFGMTGGFWERKNHIKTMQAFLEAFKDSKEVKLKIHGRFGPFKSEVIKAYQNLGSPQNIELLTNTLDASQYDEFHEDIDCYVFISKGEGFSITPRESLALGKPCILSNNTAHKTICDTGLVVPIPANIKVPAYYEVFGKNIGNFFDCQTADVALAMKEVFHNYEKYLEITQEAGPIFASKYLWSELKPLYLSIIRPQKISLGEKNIIFPTHIETNSKTLYNKIKKVFSL